MKSQKLPSHEWLLRARNASTATLLLVSFGLSGTSEAGEADGMEQPLGIGVRSVAFSPDGALLAAALGEPKERGRVVLWDVAARKELWTHAEDRGVLSVAFSPAGKTLAIAVYDHAAKLVDTRTGKVLKVFRGDKSYVRAVAFSPDSRTLATGGWNTVKLWDLATGVEKASLPCPSSSSFFALCYSPSGKWLMAAAYEATIWDAVTGKQIRSVKECYPRWAVFADDNSFLTGGNDGAIRLWDIATGRQHLRFQGIGSVDRLAYSPKTRLLAAILFPKGFDVFEFTLDSPTRAEAKRMRELLLKLDHDDYDVREAASKDSLAVGFVAEAELRRNMNDSPSAEVRVRCRQIREELLCKPRAQLYGHTDQVAGLAFSPDGQVLASGSRDGSVRLWSISKQKEIARLVPQPTRKLRK